LGRWALFIYLITIALPSSAFDARVLMAEGAEPRVLRGTFLLRIGCEEKVEVRKAATFNCRKQTWRIPRGAWLVTAFEDKNNQGLQLQREGFSKSYSFPGVSFLFSGNFSFDNQSVNHLEAFKGAEGLDWVAHISVQDYLYGVLAAEVPANWSMEALKAQAVASRTYFFYKKTERKDDHYDVRSDTLDQVFQLDARKRKSLITAVDDTRGLILVDKKSSKIFPAYLHADCGGQTTLESEVWRNPSSVNKKVRDPFCRSSEVNNWTFTMDREKLQNALKTVFLVPQESKLSAIYPRPDEEGRSQWVDFLFDKKNIQRIQANDLRQLLGFSNLRSAHFKVEERWDSFIFSGRGFGHGVGLCQWGAQRWAKQGKDFRFILEHYYPNAVMKALNTQDYRRMQAQLADPISL